MWFRLHVSPEIMLSDVFVILNPPDRPINDEVYREAYKVAETIWGGETVWPRMEEIL